MAEDKNDLAAQALQAMNRNDMKRARNLLEEMVGQKPAGHSQRRTGTEAVQPGDKEKPLGQRPGKSKADED